METTNKNIIEAFTLSQLEEAYRKVREGITIEDLKTAFYSAVENKDLIISEINKAHTIDSIRKKIYAHPGLKNSELVEDYFEALLMGFKVTEGLLSYNPYSGGLAIGGTYNKNAFIEALTKEIEKQTQEDCDKYAQKVKEEKEKREKIFTNPETLEEFQIFIRVKGKAALTAEQLLKYEELAADKTLEKQEVEAEKKAIVQAVTIEADLKIHETTHTQKGHKLWVVKLSERVDREVYNDLNNKAKKLGGYYSSYAKNGAIPGFTFTEKEAAEKFVSLKEGDQRTDKYDNRREQRAENAVNKFYEMADRLQEVGFEKYCQERKENTARRARMAASAQADAERTIYWGKVLNKLGEKLEAKEFKYLSRINCFTQVIELRDLLQRAFSKRVSAEKFSHDQYELEKLNYEANLNYVFFPLPQINKEHLKTVCQKLQNRSGQKRRSEKFLKALSRSKREYTIVFGPSGISELKILISDYTGWEADYIKEEILSYERIIRMGLESIEILKMALREFIPCLQVSALTEEQENEKAIKKLEREFVGRKIEGFFPTPENLVEEMVTIADIQEGEMILEPSAGLGHIADFIADQYPDNQLHCVEIYSSLREALQAKGHEVVEHNFLSLTGEYDKIIMNPPFESNQDIDHVLHAYNNCLKPGGRIVAIVCAGAFNREGKKETEFRTWLESINASSEQLPEGSFKTSFRPTGVNTYMIIIDKPTQESPKNESRSAGLTSRSLIQLCLF